MRNYWGSPTWKSKQERGLQRSQRDNRGDRGTTEHGCSWIPCGNFIFSLAQNWVPTAFKCFYFSDLICVWMCMWCMWVRVVCSCVYATACAHVHMWRPMEVVYGSPLPLSVPLRPGLSLHPELDWQPVHPRNLHGARGYKFMESHTYIPGIWTWILTLTQQVLLPDISSSSP